MCNKDKFIKYAIYIISVAGLICCVAVLFPQIRQLIIETAEHIMHRKTSLYTEWHRTFLSYAMGGICFILLFDFCTLTASGRIWVRQIKNEIQACWSDINFRSWKKPFLLLFGVYLLGILSLIRANFLYLDDIGRTVSGYRGWYDWSRYVSEFFSIFINADTRLTDISPLLQLLAILILAVSSVLLVYVLCDKKISVVGLLAAVPLGLSPFMLECLSYKYDAPHMALSILSSIFPFLFIERRKAFVFCSVVSLLVMTMTYQAASGIYLLVALMIGFQYWNGKRKSNKELLLFLGRAALSYCLAMIIFKLFLMKPYSSYASNEMLPLYHLFSGVWINLNKYVLTLNNDLSFIWKVFIALILFFFVVKSVRLSGQNKWISLLISVLFVCLLFPVSYGVYLMLVNPLYGPRALYGFGVLLAITGVYVVSGFNNIAKICALALSWCFFVFAFSYGNALADQMRYVNFRAGILLHDLSALYPDKDENPITIQLHHTIGYTPSVKNIAAHNPVIYRLVPQMLCEEEHFSILYYLEYFNYDLFKHANSPINVKNDDLFVDFYTLDLPIVLNSYYHTIRSDGKRVLVELKE